MADTDLLGGTTFVDASVDVFPGVFGPFFTDTQTAGIVYVDSNDDLVTLRSTNAHLASPTWTRTVRKAITAFKTMDVVTDFQFDGTTAHIAAGYDSTMQYFSWDIANDTWGGDVQVHIVGWNATIQNNACFIGISKNENLYIGFDDAAGEAEMYRSTDSGATWGARTANPYEGAAGDFARAAPANTADGADLTILFYDHDASAITVKMYDDSADTVTESAVHAMSGNAIFKNNFAVQYNTNDDLVYLVGWNGVDSATGELMAATIAPTSIATPVVTQLTDVVAANKPESGGASILIDEDNNEVYVVWAEGGTFTATTTVKYTKTTDGGTTWATPTTVSDTSDDIKFAACGGLIRATYGGRFLPVWANDDLQSLNVNYTNANIEIAAGAGGGGDTGKRRLLLGVG